MPPKPKKTKKREAQDITVINLRAANKRITALEKQVKILDDWVAHLINITSERWVKQQPARRGRK